MAEPDFDFDDDIPFWLLLKTYFCKELLYSPLADSY
jgi:hypothetical protein